MHDAFTVNTVHPNGLWWRVCSFMFYLWRMLHKNDPRGKLGKLTLMHTNAQPAWRLCYMHTKTQRDTHFLSRSHGFLFISYTEMAKITIANTETNFCICLFPFLLLISSLWAKETGKLYSLLAFMLQQSIAIFCRPYNINTGRANIYILLYKIKTNTTF